MKTVHAFAALVALLCLAGCPAASDSPDASTATDAGASAGADAAMPPDAAAPGPDAGPAPCDGRSTPEWVARQSAQRFAFTCGTTALEVSFVDEGTARLRYQAVGKPDRSFAVVAQPQTVAVKAGGPPDRFSICGPGLSVHVLPDCRVRVEHADGTPLVEDAEGGGYFENTSGLRGVKRALRAEEHVYGLGEKNGPLDKRGQSYVMRNTDAFDSAWEGFAPGSDPLYQAIPFYVGLNGAAAYGVFTDNTYRTRFDVGATDPNLLLVTADAGVIDQYVFAGPSMAEVLSRYTALTGRMPMPPLWTLGYHQSRWGYSPDTEVKDVAKTLREKRIPADGIWLDIQHMDGFRSFTWDAKTFPDPAGLIAGLEKDGFKTTLIVDPGIKVDSGWSIYSQGVADGHFLLGLDGQPFVGEVWPGAATFPDFSAAKTRAWWGTLLAPSLKLGVRGLWVDMNEPASFKVTDGRTVPDEVPANGDGQATTMAEIHNAYALLEAKATWEGMKAAAPTRRPFVLTRAGYAGEQRYVAVWTGDAPSQWQTLQETVPMLLNLGLSGVPFVGSDVGGYAGRATAEMFARWMQVGSISPFFRGHTQNTGARQEPWAFGTEVEDISRAEIQRRYELLPYLYSLFDEAHRTGAPVLRPLVWEFASDPGTHTRGDEVMLGPWMLIAPVLEAGAKSRSVYLPPGRWFEVDSGAVVEGPATVTVDLRLAARPTYVREGAILPRIAATQWIGEKPATVLELAVYPGSKPSSFTLYEDDGESFAYESGQFSRVRYDLERTATGAKLTASAREGSFAPPTRSLAVTVRRVDHAPSAVVLDGQALVSRASASEARASGGYWYDAADLSVLVVFPDRAGFTLELDYDPALVAPAPDVPVTFEVAVPTGTPATAPVCIASSANAWAHTQLAWVEAGKLARGTLPVPRGGWFEYKFTRCDWPTVEKWTGCAEATNRYGFGAAHPDRKDAVATWADWCL